MFPAGVKKKNTYTGLLLFSGCLLLLHGFAVALKSFPLIVPLMVHVDPGWLLLSPIIFHSLLILFLTFNLFSLFFFYFVVFSFVSFNFASL